MPPTKTIVQLSNELTAIRRREADAMHRYDHAPDGSDAKQRAIGDLRVITGEIVAKEKEIDAAYEEMQL